ncbi:MaoC family dehydratase [Pseudomonas sp. BGM005]|nr:MaoC family dehydratase [Pseudomonas sp. BG5]
MQISKLTGRNSYFEDFEVGQTMRHMRGKTISEVENVLITNLVMNTAQGHFNEHFMQTVGAKLFPQIISYGGVNLSIVFGLATQDTCENALAELGMDNIRFTKPVGHGDTLYAVTKVLELRDADREDAGIVRFHHVGINERNVVVAEGERIVLIKRRSHWGER